MKLPHMFHDGNIKQGRVVMGFSYGEGNLGKQINLMYLCLKIERLWESTHTDNTTDLPSISARSQSGINQGPCSNTEVYTCSSQIYHGIVPFIYNPRVLKLEHLDYHVNIP
uniref:Uncharacterized protein n=1 Tax=Arion vulgaris TaxID=1028688 RepID=A0A0B7BE65_9EUPU